MPYFVIDAENHWTSFSLKTETQESFKTEKAALKRARELAKNDPLNHFYVVKDIAKVFVPSEEPVIESTR